MFSSSWVLSIKRYCVDLCRVSLVPTFIVGAFVVVAPTFAQTGSISGSLNPCTIAGGGTICTSTISWNSSGTTAVDVWVSQNGGSEVLFGSSGPGLNSAAAPWIGASNSYAFNLYDYSSGSRGAMLASTTVTGVYSVSVSMTNGTRAIGSNFVVGDAWTFAVTGGPPGVTVQIQWTSYTGSNSNYGAGTTNGSGALSVSGTALSASIGRYTGQALLAGVAAGNPFNTELIAQPTALSVNSEGGLFNCAGSYPQPYGFGIENIVWDTDGQTYGDETIPMVARSYVSYGSPSYSEVSVSLGENPGFTQPWNPMGWCTNYPFSPVGFTENIWISIGGIFPANATRTNNWVQTSTVAHSGTLTNNNDISLTK